MSPEGGTVGSAWLRQGPSKNKAGQNPDEEAPARPPPHPRTPPNPPKMDNSPTSLFDSYESDFQTITASIQEKLEVDAMTQKGEQRKATLRRVEMELDEADEMVSV